MYNWQYLNIVQNNQHTAIFYKLEYTKQLPSDGEGIDIFPCVSERADQENVLLLVKFVTTPKHEHPRIESWHTRFKRNFA